MTVLEFTGWRRREVEREKDGVSDISISTGCYLRGLQERRDAQRPQGRTHGAQKEYHGRPKERTSGLERVCGVSVLIFFRCSCFLDGAGTSVGP